MRVRLDVVSNICLTIACCVVTTAVIARMFQPRPVSQPRMQSYAQGEKVPQIAGVNYAGSETTLILAISSTCRYCTASMDLYRRLVEARESVARLQIVAASTDDTQTFESYLASHSLRPDVIAKVQSGELMAPGTPTLVVVNRKGIAQRSWVGKLTPAAERELFGHLGLPVRSASLGEEFSDDPGGQNRVEGI